VFRRGKLIIIIYIGVSVRCFAVGRRDKLIIIICCLKGCLICSLLAAATSSSLTLWAQTPAHGAPGQQYDWVNTNTLWRGRLPN